ncbi:hypothetical protein LG293_16440 (plasmid) [Citricoccus nitrophenolicus]
MASTINSLYMLTEMTGRRSNENRTVVIASFEMRARHFWVAAFSLVPGLLVLLLMLPAMGQWAIVWPLLFVVAAFLITETRTRTGLKQRVYKELAAKKVSRDGQFILAGHPIDPRSAEFGAITQTAIPLTPPASHGQATFIDITEATA